MRDKEREEGGGEEKRERQKETQNRRFNITEKRTFIIRDYSVSGKTNW